MYYFKYFVDSYNNFRKVLDYKISWEFITICH